MRGEARSIIAKTGLYARFCGLSQRQVIPTAFLARRIAQAIVGGGGMMKRRCKNTLALEIDERMDSKVPLLSAGSEKRATEGRDHLFEELSLVEVLRGNNPEIGDIIDI